jgi:hypothetical protein
MSGGFDRKPGGQPGPVGGASAGPASVSPGKLYDTLYKDQTQWDTAQAGGSFGPTIHRHS